MTNEETLPPGWVMTALCEVVQLGREKIESSEFADAHYLGLEHIESQTGRIIGRASASTVRSTKAVFRPGDVLYGRLRPYLNKVCQPDFAGVCSTDILVLHSSTAVLNSFLRLFLSQRDVVEYARHHSKGINLPRIGFGELAEMQFALPPLAEQHRIVAKATELQSRGEKTRKALEVIPLLLERFRQSVLAAAFCGDLTANWRTSHPDAETADRLLGRIRTERRREWEKLELARLVVKGKTPKDEKWKPNYEEPLPADIADLPDLPDGWGWASLDEVCSLIADIDHKMPKAAPSGVKFLSAKDLLNDGTLNLTDDIKLISEEDYHRLARKGAPRRNDIIYSRIGARLGKARLVETDERFLVSYSCCTIRPLMMRPRYLAWFLDSGFVLARAMRGAQSIGVPDLGLDRIKRFAVPVCTLEEQDAVVALLESAFARTDAVGKVTAELNGDGRRMDEKILARAFRGELVSQDPRDEPASALLERTRAERAKKRGQ